MEDDVPAPPFEVVEPPTPAAAPAVTNAPAEPAAGILLPLPGFTLTHDAHSSVGLYQ